VYWIAVSNLPYRRLFNRQPKERKRQAVVPASERLLVSAWQSGAEAIGTPNASARNVVIRNGRGGVWMLGHMARGLTQAPASFF
jgi:hypothetical protein